MDDARLHGIASAHDTRSPSRGLGSDSQGAGDVVRGSASVWGATDEALTAGPVVAECRRAVPVGLTRSKAAAEEPPSLEAGVEALGWWPRQESNLRHAV
jgi:hypothetical protein